MVTCAEHLTVAQDDRRQVEEKVNYEVGSCMHMGQSFLIFFFGGAGAVVLCSSIWV